MKIELKSKNSVTFIRYLLATLIVVSHSFYVGNFYGGKDPFRFKAFINSYENLGGIAVASFFILSGYLITGSYIRINSIFRFLWHRFLRIFPGFWLCLFISVFMLGSFVYLSTYKKLTDYSSYPIDSPYGYIINNFTLIINQTNIANLFGNNPVPFRFNDSLWTLSYEFICYLSIAFLGVIGILKKSRKIVLGLFVALWLTFNMFFTKESMVSSNYILFRTFELFTYFYMGSVFYLFRDKIIINKTILLFLLLISTIFIYYQLFFLIAPFLIGYILFIMIIIIPFNNFGRFGDFSYGLYLYAFPVEQMLAFYKFNNYGFIPFISASLFLGTILAAISYWLIEYPCLKLKNIKFKIIL